MAPLGQRLLLVFGLLVGFLSNLAQARIIDRDLIYSTDLLNLVPRAPTAQLNWPCLPDKRKPKAEGKDPGASVGVLPYTAAMVIAANANHVDIDIPSNATAIAARHPQELSEQHGSRDLAKRLGGAITALYNQALVKVPTDGSYMIYWQYYVNSPEELIIATNDLSGCTVIIVSSPHVVLMAHVWERRDENGWLMDPFGVGQQAKDAEFVAAGSTLLDNLLTGLGGNALNGYGGWLPRDSTTIHIVAPAANPDYEDPVNPRNPWYTGLTQQGLIYQDATTGLLAMASAKIGTLNGEILTYRRRYSNDVDHGTDDRDKIAISPYIMDGHTYVNLMWDDDQMKPIAQIN